MAPNTTLTSALIVLGLAYFASAPTEPESLHDETKSLSGVITKTGTFLCSARLGVPISMASPGNSLQIYLDNYLGEEMVVASAFSYGETKVGETFIQRAPQATVEGNITEGWLEVIIPDLTDETLGNYKCVLNQVQSSGHVKYNRSLTVGRQSYGTLYSHPMGFEATVFNKVTVQCGIESGCYCNKSFSIQFLENQEDEKLNKNCEEIASWQCENDLKKPLAQVQCHLSVMCGKVKVWFNCTKKNVSSTSLYEFICGPPVLSQMSESFPNNTGSAKPNIVEQNSGFSNLHLIWIIPLSTLVLVLAMYFFKHCFSICIFCFVLKKYFDISFNKNSTVSVQTDVELKSIQVDYTSRKEIQPLLPQEDSQGLSESVNDAAAAARSVMFKPHDRKDVRKNIFPAVQDEETDIDTKSKCKKV